MSQSISFNGRIEIIELAESKTQKGLIGLGLY